MRKIAAFAFLILVSVHSFAKPVDLNTARTVARNYFHHFNNEVSSRLNQDYFNTDAITNPAFYVFDFAPKGFIIVSADDRCMPIIGYSTEVNYTVPTENNNVKYWLDSKATEVHYIVDNDLKATEEITNQWNAGINNTIARAKAGSAILPLLKTTWDQGSYYNFYCPADASSVIGNGKVPVGCVATAMAQIMKYWEYPTQGNGSYSYNAGSYGSQSANFGTTFYDFKDMKNYASASSYLQIATLSYQCGVAVRMGYGASGSGAQVVGANYPSSESAFKNYFRYNSSKLKSYSQSNFSTTNWINMIEAELNLRRPIEYDGFDPSGGGHAWVCDGYDVSDKLHMNWGWSGHDNGYFTVGALNPSSLGTGGGTGGGFNSGCDIIIGIEPYGDSYEGTNGDNTLNTAYQTPMNFVNDSATFITSYASIHTLTDTDYYAFNLPSGYNYTISSAAYDKSYRANVGNFTEDVLFRYSIGSSNFGFDNDDTIAPYTAAGGNVLYYKVFPYDNTIFGTYQLNVKIKRTAWATGVGNVAVNKINVYPNPANESVVINSNKAIGNIEIADVVGKIVMTKTNITDFKTTIDVSALPNGIYFIKTNDAEQSFTQKIVVNR